MKWAAITAARMTRSQHVWRDQQEFDRGADGIHIKCDDTRVRAEKDWRPRVPFIVLLRHCPGGKLPSPQEFPKLISQALGDPPPNWVTKILKGGRGLVLLDGVDEIPHAHRPELRRSLADLLQAYPKSYFVLTTRPEAVEPDWLAEFGFREVEVIPMSQPDRDGFIRRWYDVVAKGRNEPGIREKAEQLIADLATAPWLAQLVTNPMLCAMTCAQYLASRGTLPESLREMCETLCKVLLHQLDLERKIDLSTFPHPYPVMNYGQKKAVMRQVAYKFVMNELSALSTSDVGTAVALALGRMPDRSEAEAEPVFTCILERSGMMRESTPEDEKAGIPATIEFLHNTFKEFLAGEQIAAEGLHQLVLDKLDQEVWRRVGLFAFAAGSVAFQNSLLAGVFASIPQELSKASRKRTDLNTEKARARAIFALQCRGLATQCDETVKERLNAVASQVVPPRTVADAAWLAAAGNVVVPHLKYKKRKGSVQLACVRALKLIGTPEALHELVPYGVDNRIPVVQELFGTVHCTSPDIYSLHVTRRRLPGLAGIGSLSGLHFLSLWNCEGVSDLAPLTDLPGLENLRLFGADVSDLAPLAKLTRLQDLHLGNCARVTDIAPLAHLSRLRFLFLSGCVGISDLAPLTNLTLLSDLYLNACAGLTNLAPLANLTQLQNLDLHSCPGVSNLIPLTNLTRLQALNVFRTGVSDLSPLANLTQLRRLDLASTKVSDLAPLAALTQLQWLDLTDTEVTDLSPLAHLAHLQEIQLYGVSADRDCLVGITNLQILG